MTLKLSNFWRQLQINIFTYNIQNKLEIVTKLKERKLLNGWNLSEEEINLAQNNNERKMVWQQPSRKANRSADRDLQSV